MFGCGAGRSAEPGGSIGGRLEEIDHVERLPRGAADRRRRRGAGVCRDATRGAGARAAATSQAAILKLGVRADGELAIAGERFIRYRLNGPCTENALSRG